MELSAYIDHTLLTATATSDEIKRLCEEAVEYGFATVCVSPRWVGMAADILHSTKVNVGSVVGFSLGAESTTIKAAQARELIFAGADEVDMVADIAAIIEGDRGYFANELNSVLKVCRSMRPSVILKVIIESAVLTHDQKILACEVCEKSGVDFVKTSTGLHPAGGASAEDVKLMAQTAPSCKIKAAGGIRTLEQAMEMIDAGASRIGTSGSVEIMEELKNSNAGDVQ